MGLTLFRPKFQLFINDFDVTTAVEPYLISIKMDDFFDTNFTISKLELLFHAKYTRNSSWKYKDKLRFNVWYEILPTNVYQSEVFYVDLVEDIKASGGLQTYRINALAADPNLGFSYSAKQLTYTNKQVKTALSEFSTLFGLTLSENASSNIYLGVCDNDVNVCEISFDSYADFLTYVCNTYGYLGNLSGTTLTIEQINTAFTSTRTFDMWKMNEIFNLDYRETYSQLYKKYTANYIDRNDGNALRTMFLRPAMHLQLNNKEITIESESFQYNEVTGAEKIYGKLHQDFLSGFEVTINSQGLPNFIAGNVFNLDASYGKHEGFYRCTQISHSIDSRGWNTQTTGFPLKTLKATIATFDIGYFGNNNNPSDPNKIFELSQIISGRTFVLAANKFDEYAKYVNTDYTANFGNIFLTEGNKSANSIKPELAFSLAMVISDNFKDQTLMSKNNPFGLDSSANVLATFSTITIGIRAGIQHLFAYSKATGNPADPIVDPSYGFATRGIAPKLTNLTNRMNSIVNLGENAKEKMLQFYKKAYPDYNNYFID